MNKTEELWARELYRSAMTKNILGFDGVPNGIRVNWFVRFMDEFVGRIWDACAVLRHGYYVDRED